MSSTLRAATTAAANAAGLINTSSSSSDGAATSAAPSRPAVSRTVSRLDVPSQPATAPPLGKEDSEEMVLELANGSSHKGISFGAQGKSISGECVFQTGMVGYVESLTDPSYEGQILVLTFPLVGNYGVPSRKEAESSIQALLASPFESDRIHIAGLVIAYYSHEFSHYLAESSLGDWLKENGVPAIYGVDTRALTKKIRSKGSMLGKLLSKRVGGTGASLTTGSGADSWRAEYVDVPFADPNSQNLVAKVSVKKPVLYTPSNTSAGGSLGTSTSSLLHPTGRPIRILALDVGMKYNQIRCFTSRGVELKVVPWDHDFLNPSIESEPFDGLFISNGPGDPTSCGPTIERIRQLISLNGTSMIPVFGICLGHQLLALAAGAKTEKMKFGNRGHNIPCTDQISGRCYITSQNHGYAVNGETLPNGWNELFVNANDGSNEGIFSNQGPFFSVQFHPESTPGPRDTEFLFDVFIRSVLDCATVKSSPSTNASTLLPPVGFTGGLLADNAARNPKVHVRKVLVLGSGGLWIGQAGEFDYASYISENVDAIKTVQALGREHETMRVFDHRAKSDPKRTGYLIWGAGGFAISQAMVFLLCALIFFYGGKLLAEGTVDVTKLYATFEAVIIGSFGAGRIFTFVNDFGRAKSSFKSVTAWCMRQPRIASIQAPEGKVGDLKPAEDIVLDDVEMRYPQRPKHPALRSLNLTIKAGSTVAFCGTSGSGKSSILALLQRFYDPSRGTIEIGGVDVRAIPLEEFRSQMAFVSQEPTLYGGGSIAWNLRLGSTDPDSVTQEEIEDACEAACILDFVRGLPEGFETDVGLKGAQLSGGQKQRLCIARALIRKPKILLLDEATSALDAESELSVQRALENASKGRTTISIAHRLSTIRNADEIHVVEDGNIIESGSHDELLRRRGRYLELIEAQL